MSVLFMLTGIALALFLIGAVVLIWSVRNGQWDDLDTPAQRMLGDDPTALPKTSAEKSTTP